MSKVSEALDHIEAVIRDDEIDLSDVDTPAKAKNAQLELVAHLRDQLCADDATSASLDQATLRRVYDALRELYQRKSTSIDSFECGWHSGVNASIDALIAMNGGFAPSPQHGETPEGGQRS